MYHTSSTKPAQQVQCTSDAIKILPDKNLYSECQQKTILNDALAYVFLLFNFKCLTEVLKKMKPFFLSHKTCVCLR